jgi:hypothetical protein
MKIQTLIFLGSQGLNRVFSGQINTPRFSNDPKDAIRFDNDLDAQEFINTMLPHFKNRLSLQHFVKS